MTYDELLQALIEGSYGSDDEDRLSPGDILEVFEPGALILTEIRELLPFIAGYGDPAPSKLYVKWGTDDPVQDPIKLPAIPTDSWEYQSWRIELYLDQIRVVPKGSQSGGAGDVIIWYSYTPPALEEHEVSRFDATGEGEPTSDYTNQDPDLKGRPTN